MHQSDHFATSLDSIGHGCQLNVKHALFWLWNIAFQIICGIIQFPAFLWLIHEPKCSTARINSHIAQSLAFCFCCGRGVWKLIFINGRASHRGSKSLLKCIRIAYYRAPPHLLKFILDSPCAHIGINFHARELLILSVSISVWAYQIQRLSSAQSLPTNSFGSFSSRVYTYSCEI